MARPTVTWLISVSRIGNPAPGKVVSRGGDGDVRIGACAYRESTKKIYVKIRFLPPFAPLFFPDCSKNHHFRCRGRAGMSDFVKGPEGRIRARDRPEGRLLLFQAVCD